MVSDPVKKMDEVTPSYFFKPAFHLLDIQEKHYLYCFPEIIKPLSREDIQNYFRKGQNDGTVCPKREKGFEER